VSLLQLAYSGELAAALAYQGHWRSVSELAERSRIQTIENEELHHRRQVGEMLKSLNSAPDAAREKRAVIIGRSIGFLCHVLGWLAPMYGAGRLESRNVKEYEAAARFAWGCGRRDFVDCLLTMAEVEWEHENYFRSNVARHWLGRRLRLWPKPPPKETIRSSFEEMHAQPAGAAH
jgi:rubrerythrin